MRKVRDARFADHTVRDEPVGERLRSAEAELGAEEVHDTRGLRGIEHRLRFTHVARERLLAHDVLPGGHRLEHQVVVGQRRCGDRDRGDAGSLQCLLERRGREGDLEAFRPRPRALGVTADKRRLR